MEKVISIVVAPDCTIVTFVTGVQVCSHPIHPFDFKYVPSLRED